MDKYQFIMDNFVNGNLSDVKEAIKKLSKIQLLELIMEWKVYLDNDNPEVALIRLLK